MKKYPLILKPVIKDYIWGGRRLIDEFGFETDANSILIPRGVSTKIIGKAEIIISK